MALSDITPVIIAHNAEATLPETLESLSAFPQVVVYENGSTAQTVAIADSFDNV